MNSKSRLSVLGVLLAFFSCSEKAAIDQNIFLEISEKKKFHIGGGGLTNEGYHTVFLDSSKTEGTIYNQIAHSLDSIFITADSAWSQDGTIMDFQGPYGVGTVFSYFSTPDFNVFSNSQEFYRQNIKTKEVSRKLLFGYEIFGDLKYPALSVASTAREFKGFDSKTNTAYFTYDHDYKIKIIGYQVDKDSMFVVPVELDSSQYYNTRFRVKSESMIMDGGDHPQLSVLGNKLVISYPSFSDIFVYDLNSGLQERYTSDSKSFPSQKKHPENYREEISSPDLLDQWLPYWRNQVRFGSMIYNKALAVYIRGVKGEGEENPPLYLEVFNEDFDKVDELNISEISQDLSITYVNTKYGLMIRAKTQPEEDVMYYYNVNLRESK